MAFTQISTSVTIINSGLIGYCGISLTEFTTSAVSLIASGSGVEISGAFFKADTDITPNASSWTAVTTATTAYLQLTPSGTAGTQILSASWLTSGTVWSTSKQGWYASAASISRVVASAYKVGPTTSASTKQLLGNNQSMFESYRWQGQKELLTASSGSYIVPSNVYRLRVTCIGGGGGGSGGFGTGSSAAASAGSSTTFVGATTGTGGGGGLSNAAYAGGAGATGNAGAPGHGYKLRCGGNGGGAGGIGNEASVGGVGSYGGGGGGGGGSGIGGGVGGSGGGGTAISGVLGDTLAVVPGQSIAYTVGSGGAGSAGNGAGAYAGGDGGAGVIIVEY